MTADERGTILPLVAGFTVIALLLVLGAIDASAAFLAQRDLASVCDGAALSAAQSVSPQSVYERSAGQATLPLDAGLVTQAVRTYQDRNYAGDAGGLSMDASVVDAAGGPTVTVVCRRTARLPFGALVGYANGLPRTAVSSARAPLR